MQVDGLGAQNWRRDGGHPLAGGSRRAAQPRPGFLLLLITPQMPNQRRQRQRRGRISSARFVGSALIGCGIGKVTDTKCFGSL